MADVGFGDITGSSGFGQQGYQFLDRANRRIGNVPGYQGYQIGPESQGLLNQQQTAAKQFRSGLPAYEQQQYLGAENNARRNLANKMSGITGNYASRGLLYSGLKQGAQSQAGSDTASQLAQQRMGINTGALDMANQMENQAIQSGMQTQAMKQQLKDDEYNRNLQYQQASQQGAGGLTRNLGGGIGSLWSK